MSSRLAVVLAARVLCVFFLYEAFATATSLPFSLFDLWLNWHLSADPAIRQTLGHNAMAASLRGSSRLVEASLLRFIVDLFLAVLFYRCGLRVSRFLLGKEGESLPPEGTI